MLVIKLFGLYSFVSNLFSVLPNNLSIVLSSPDLFGVLWMIVVVLIVSTLFIYLIFKAEKVVDLLKLQQGFTDDKIIIGKLWSKDIMRLGTFMIGGLLLLDNIPGFLSHTLFAFKVDVSGYRIPNDDYFGLFKTGLNITIGIILISNFNFIVRLLRIKSNND